MALEWITRLLILNIWWNVFVLDNLMRCEHLHLWFHSVLNFEWWHSFDIVQVSFSGSTQQPNIYSPDDLPKTVVRNLNQGSNVMSMDFHPQQQTVLLGWPLTFFFLNFSFIRWLISFFFVLRHFVICVTVIESYKTNFGNEIVICWTWKLLILEYVTDCPTLIFHYSWNKCWWYQHLGSWLSRKVST